MVRALDSQYRGSCSKQLPGLMVNSPFHPTPVNKMIVHNNLPPLNPLSQRRTGKTLSVKRSHGVLLVLAGYFPANTKPLFTYQQVTAASYYSLLHSLFLETRLVAFRWSSLPYPIGASNTDIC